MEKKATLLGIDNDHKITKETDHEFLYELQKALLLALKERGTLNEMQYRIAHQKLKTQHQAYMKRWLRGKEESQ